MRRLPLVVAGLAGISTALPAQEREPSWASRSWAAVTDSSRAVWVRPLASLLVPGSGQLMSGADRGVVYLGLEVFLIVGAVSAGDQAQAAEVRYRDLAWDVARSSFTTTRRDTVFEYYEAMQGYVESGVYDLDPGPGFAPETAAGTYNGSVWELARQTFFTDPDSTPDPSSEAYQRALGFYRDHAIGPDFRWSWRNAGLEHELFRHTIVESDDAYRTSTLYLGFLIANHLVAALDAFVSERLAQAARRPVSVEAVLTPRGGAVTFAVAF